VTRAWCGEQNALLASMFLILAIILAVAWFTGFAVFHVSVAAIHLLLILAAIGLVIHFMRGGRAATT
jgi:hypothetical protein